MTSDFKTLASRWILALLLTLAAGHAMAAGALAIDTLQGEKYGFSFNHPSVDQADQRSMRECGADCSVVLRFSGQCAAYAADQTKGSNAYGWGTGTTSANAQARAMSECQAKGGSSCKVRAWGCDAITSTAPQAATNPAPQARPPAAAQPAPQNNPPAQSGFAMMGEWLVDYVSPTGYTASGTLRVTDNLGNGNFRGVMVQSYTSTGGVAKRVQQDMLISVRGDTVVMNASNPVYLQGTGSYSPDNYTLSLASPNLLRGKNSDNAGVGGAVIISRR
jgi:hypothetical protein